MQARASAAAAPVRLASLDALRGFDMVWIVGAEALMRAFRDLSNTGLTNALVRQLSHADWAGFTFYDLIFPLFIFIAGASMVFSLDRHSEHGGSGESVRRLLRRGAFLYLAGIFYYGGILDGLEGVRWLGVLQRIALASMLAGLLALGASTRRIAATVAAILLGYWAIMALVPVPGFGSGNFDEGKNLANWLDARWLPGRKYDGDWDPEGLLSTLPAIATCLLGFLAGRILTAPKPSPSRKVLLLVAWGAAGIALGWAWHPVFPVIKKIWTSSYVLVSAGWSAILLGAFYWAVDLRGMRRSALPLIWLGANALAVYLLHNLVNVNAISFRLVGGDIAHLAGPWAGLLLAAVTLGITFLAARFLYVRRIFIKL
jgi:predicted acyltransferase